MQLRLESVLLLKALSRAGRKLCARRVVGGYPRIVELAVEVCLRLEHLQRDDAGLGLLSLPLLLAAAAAAAALAAARSSARRALSAIALQLRRVAQLPLAHPSASSRRLSARAPLVLELNAEKGAARRL